MITIIYSIVSIEFCSKHIVCEFAKQQVVVDICWKGLMQQTFKGKLLKFD